MGEGTRGDRPSNDDVRTGLSVAAFKRAYEENLRFALGRFPQVASLNDRYLALAYAVRASGAHHTPDEDRKSGV